MDDQRRAYLKYCSRHNDGTAVPFETFKVLKNLINRNKMALEHLSLVKHEKWAPQLITFFSDSLKGLKEFLK